MFARLAFATAFGALPLLGWAQAVPVQPLVADAHGVRIEGVRASACEPTVSHTAANAAGGIDIVLAAERPDCTLDPQAFALQWHQGETFSPRPPRALVQPVRVFVEAAGQAPQLAGFALQGGTTPDITPDSGFWWPAGDAGASGNLLSLELQGDALGIALLGHDDLSGAPLWYFGTGRLHGRRAHVRLSRLDEGASPFFGLPTQPVPHAGMTIDIAFDSGTHARAWLSRPDPVRAGAIELVALEFTRRSFSNQPQARRWLGHWLVAHDAPAGAAEIWPATIDFTDAHRLGSDGWQLLARDGLALECVTDPATQSARQCTLRGTDGAPIVQFDQVGLDQLTGRDNDGRRVVLLRRP